MAQLQIRKDTEEEIIEVNTGDGWRGVAPTAAYELANGYEAGIEEGDQPDTPQTRQFVSLLREYADELEA